MKIIKPNTFKLKEKFYNKIVKKYWLLLLIVIFSSCSTRDNYYNCNDIIMEQSGPTKYGSIVPEEWIQNRYLKDETY